MVVPKELRCGPEFPRGWTEVPEVLRVPKGGMVMEKESDGAPPGPQEWPGDLEEG